GSSFKCYSCTAQVSNANCKMSVDCKDSEMCKTDVIGIMKLFNVISKGCASSCEASYQDLTVGSRNISCCNSDLCNVNAVSRVRCSYGMAAVISASMLWTFLDNR
ncbi:PSCA protein, partial [Nothocercus julius]|nr:PSCA protein [Nothocercus julius]NXD16403.1 PSCA protein [Nothocercus nigrocapillus]